MAVKSSWATDPGFHKMNNRGCNFKHRGMVRPSSHDELSSRDIERAHQSGHLENELPKIQEAAEEFLVRQAERPCNRSAHACLRRPAHLDPTYKELSRWL
jgi:hypothetical protein